MQYEFGQSLGHVFHRPELLQQALTHRSSGPHHNERLEFIGDAALNCAIAMALFQRFPQMPEGELSRLRSNLVNKDTLFRLAQSLGLGRVVRLGEGELREGPAAGRGFACRDPATGRGCDPRRADGAVGP